MAKQKVQTLQEKREAEMKANLEIMKQRMAAREEQKAQEAARLAARTPEEIAADEAKDAADKARWSAQHQAEIETFRARRSVETEEEMTRREQVRARNAEIARIADEGE